MTQAEALYKLQQIELDMARKQKRLDEIASALEDDASVRSARDTLEAATKALSPVRARVRDLELEIQSTEQKSQNTEQQLYSGTVKNPKAMQDMQQEIESLKKWKAELEDRLLEAMVALEEAEETHTEAESNLKAITASWESDHTDLLDEQGQLEDAVSELQKKREQAVSKITAQNLKIYLSLKPRRANQPMALLQSSERSCSACGVQQTVATVQAVEHGEKLTPCESCGRLLVFKA